MRNVVWILLLAIVAVVAASALGSNDGLVSIYWLGWRTDVSFNLFVILREASGKFCAPISEVLRELEFSSLCEGRSYLLGGRGDKFQVSSV